MSKQVLESSMKDFIRERYADVEKVLKLSNLEDSHKDIIFAVVKELSYQWCKSNAAAHSFKDSVKKTLSDEDFNLIPTDEERKDEINEIFMHTFPDEFLDDFSGR